MRRLFRFSTESVTGVRDVSPNGQFYIPMDTANSFKPLTTRPVWTIKDGSGLNVPRLRGSEIVAIGGKLTSRVYWEDATWRLGWLTRVNSAQSSPWTTDQPATDFASATLDFMYTYDNNQEKWQNYYGCKPGANITINCQNQPDNPFLVVDQDIFGLNVTPLPTYTTTPASTFAEPALTAYSADPITFQESTFTWLNTPLPFYDRFSITISNMVKPYFDNGRFANRIRMRGRTVTLTAHPLLQVLTDPRLKYEAMVALGNLSVQFNKGPNQLNFNFRSSSYLDSVSEDMILDEDAYVDFTATAHLDTGAGDDFTITSTITTI